MIDVPRNEDLEVVEDGTMSMLSMAAEISTSSLFPSREGEQTMPTW